MDSPDEYRSFRRLLLALQPWLDRIVIVGGWAHRLYRLHPYAQSLRYPPLLTVDTDIALPSAIVVKGQDLRQRLLAEGFTEDFIGGETPPASHYRIPRDRSGFYAEFITPLTGSEVNRDGKRIVTARIGGVGSQRLRHV